MSLVDKYNFIETELATGKLVFPPDHIQWLRDNREVVQNWLDLYTMSQGSRDHVERIFRQLPSLGYIVVRDFAINKTDIWHNVSQLLNGIIHNPKIYEIVIRGTPGTGKTTTSYKLMELLKDDFNIVTDAPFVDETALPEWIEWKPNPAQFEKGDLIMSDEASKYNARRSGSKTNVEDLAWLATGRHKGYKVIYITQMLAITDVNIQRFANVDIVKSYDTSAFGLNDVERKNVADDPLLEFFKTRDNYVFEGSVKESWSIVKGIGGLPMMTYIEPPAWMNDMLSRSYRTFDEIVKDKDPGLSGAKLERAIETIAMYHANIMLDCDYTYSKIKFELESRGFKRPLEFWKAFTGDKLTKDETAKLMKGGYGGSDEVGLLG